MNSENSLIHETAIISDSVKIGKNVKVGAFSVIDGNVEIGDDVEIMSHVCISGNTIIGDGTKIFPFAAIGYQPQDLKFHGENSRLIIGKNNSIREYVTLHPGTEGGLMETVIGDNNLLMIGVHIAHDCLVGNNVVMGNNATLAGHVTIEDDVIIGGLVAIHQFVRVGKNAIIGGMSGVERDVIPFGAVKGERAHLYDINIIGLRRAMLSREKIFDLKKVYDVIFSSEGTLSENVEKASHMFAENEEARYLINFMKQKTKRSFCLPTEFCALSKDNAVA